TIAGQSGLSLQDPPDELDESPEVTDDEVSTFVHGMVRLQSVIRAQQTRQKFLDFIEKRRSDPAIIAENDIAVKQLLLANKTNLYWIFSSFASGPEKAMDAASLQQFGFMFQLVPLVTNVRKFNMIVTSILHQGRRGGRAGHLGFLGFLLLLVALGAACATTQ
ncbi:unnamed protein product, partial [Heterosigma akashiwo]